MKDHKKILLVFLFILGSILVVFVATIGFLWLYPVKVDSLVSRPQPAGDFNESLKRIETLREQDARQELHPEGHLILLDHGQKVKRAVVFFHGLTNSPRQFRALAEQFYEQGYNVFIPRLPYHGFKNFESSGLPKLTAEDLLRATDEAVDIARGLGTEITVVGLSLGGIMAGWAAQMRADIDKAVLIAPNFGTYRSPNCFLKLSINYLLIRPDYFIWWDSEKKLALKRPATAYHGFSSRAFGEVRRLGWAVQVFAQKSAPLAKSVLVITNANDQAVKKEGVAVVVDRWRKHGPSRIQTFEFPKNLNLVHDLIDPQQINQKTAVAYPIFIPLIMDGKENEDVRSER